MTGEQIAKLIMACNELNKSRSIVAEIIKEGGENSQRLNSVLDKLTECETELGNIQNGK